MEIKYFVFWGIGLTLLIWRFSKVIGNSPHNYSSNVQQVCIISSLEFNKGSYSFDCNNYKVVTQNEKLEIGDKVSVFGKCKVRVINRYLSEYLLINPKILVGEKIVNFELKDKIKNYPVIFLKYEFDKVRKIMVEKFTRSFEERQAALISGMVLGDKTLFSEDFYEKLKKAGLVHIVVASGGNVAILVSSLEILLKKRIARKRRLGINVGFIVFYLFLTGMQIPLIRASVMFLLTQVAKFLGRKTAAIYVLLELGLVFLAINPKLIFDLSFQLSFLATAGIVLFGNELYEVWKEKWKDNNRGLIEIVGVSLSQTLSAQLLVILPLLINFQEFNFWGIIANILVSFLIAWISYGGIFFLIVGNISQIWANFGAIILKPMLDYMIWITNIFAKVSWGYWKGEVGIMGVLIWIVFLVWLKVKFLKKK